MNYYKIYCCSTREPIDVLPMHVLACAYRDAWRLMHGRDPQGKHVIDGLDVLIEFTNLPGNPDWEFLLNDGKGRRNDH
jgi:hypothetical protein